MTQLTTLIRLGISEGGNVIANRIYVTLIASEFRLRFHIQSLLTCRHNSEL